MKPIQSLSLALVLTLSSTVSIADIGPDDVQFDNSMQVKESLTGKAGDAAEGRKVFSNTTLGNCLACHAVAEQSDQLFHGEVGPVLDGVGSRYPEGLLRTIVVNAKKVYSERTLMPGFYTNDQGAYVAEKFAGKTILTAQQVEDVVAYLQTLK